MVIKADTTQRPSGRRTLDERLADAQKAELKALERFQRKNADVAKFAGRKRIRDRKLDTRRKIIAGALALEHMKHDAAFGAAFGAVLDQNIQKLAERALFDLPPLGPTTNPID